MKNGESMDRLSQMAPELGERIAAERIAVLIRQQPLALGINLLNSALFFIILIPSTSISALSAWVSAIWAVTALRAAMWYFDRGSAPTPGTAARIGRRYTAFAFATGLLWGLPGIVFFPTDPVAMQGFIVFVLGGMSAGAMATLAPHLPAFCAFVLPVLLPVIGRLFAESGLAAEDGSAYFAMGTMGLVYLLALLFSARGLNRMLGESLTLQIVKGDIADTLPAVRSQAQAAHVAKSEFLATVSHELRTPLNAILGFSHLLSDQIHGALGHSRYRDYVKHISDSGEHLKDLIEDLLTLSSAGSGKLVLNDREISDLWALLEQCRAQMEIRAAQKKLHLVLQVAQPRVTLRADPVRLRQIVLNVLSNAIMFTLEGGEVSISTERHRTGGLCITVRDTGIGMSDRELTLALESFGRADTSHTRDTEGTGIGLPLTASLMALHQGEIDIVSRPGEGTAVTLRFPPERVIDKPDAGSTDRTGVSAA